MDCGLANILVNVTSIRYSDKWWPVIDGTCRHAPPLTTLTPLTHDIWWASWRRLGRWHIPRTGNERERQQLALTESHTVPRKTWWDCVKTDNESSGVIREDAQFMDHWRIMIPFLSPNQQHKSTKGNVNYTKKSSCRWQTRTMLAKWR